MEVQQIIKEAITITEEASFKDAVTMMIAKQTNSLIVVDKDGKLVGEVSVTDLLDAVVPEYLDGDNIAAHFASSDMFTDAVADIAEQEVRYFMDTDVETVRETEGIMSIAGAAIANKRARIPVVNEAHEPVGIISRRGLKHIIADALGVTHN